MDSAKRNFDELAPDYDDNPGRTRMAANIASAISNAVNLLPDMVVLDYGCGTGLISLAIQPLVGSVLAVDSSRGMLDVLDQKLNNQNISKVRTRQLDMDEGEALEGLFDLIICSMTLHHVRKPDILINTFFEHTKAGGIICIADLEPDRGLFHGYTEGIFHHGFGEDMMSAMLENAGFTDIGFRTATEIVRFVPEGLSPFKVFLATALRP